MTTRMPAMELEAIGRLVASNRDAWDASAAHHRQSAAWQRLVAGVGNATFSCLDATLEALLAEVGIAGKDVIQIGCNNGRECLSVCALGAREVVGLDQSRAFLAQAAELAALSPHSPSFIEANVYALPPTLLGRFDVALITIGVLGWMPDIDSFFRHAAATLKPGGAILIYETHPFLDMFVPGSADPFRPAESYFRREPFVDDRVIVYEEVSQERCAASFWFVHRLSDILTALIRAGLQILRFEEHAHSIREAAYDIYAKQPAQLPMCFTLVARVHP